MSFMGLKIGDTIDEVIKRTSPWDKDYVIEQKAKGSKSFGVNDVSGRYAFMFEFDENHKIIKISSFSID